MFFGIIRAECSDNYNEFTYVDTMSRPAVEQYIRLTHERYARECGTRLGESIPGIYG